MKSFSGRSFGSKAIEPLSRSTRKLVCKQMPLAQPQLMSNAAGVAVRDPVSRTGKPLSVELGPGLTETIYLGIHRSLKSIAYKTVASIFPAALHCIPSFERRSGSLLLQ